MLLKSLKKWNARSISWINFRQSYTMIICYFRSTISHHFRQSIFTGSPFPPEIDSLIIGQAGSTRKQINSRKIHKHHTHTPEILNGPSLAEIPNLMPERRPGRKQKLKLIIGWNIFPFPVIRSKFPHGWSCCCLLPFSFSFFVLSQKLETQWQRRSA